MDKYIYAKTLVYDVGLLHTGYISQYAILYYRVTPFQPHRADAGAAKTSPGRS